MESAPSNKLISCSECNHEIASSALVCPKCGHRFAHRSYISIIIGIIFIFMSIRGIFGISSDIEMKISGDPKPSVIGLLFESKPGFDRERSLSMIMLGMAVIGLMATLYGSGLKIKK